MDAVERCAGAKRELGRKVEEAAARPERAPVVDALCPVKGIDVASAFLLAAEAGDFSRFPSAPSFASWRGLAPSGRSSGETESRGGITRAGNGRVEARREVQPPPAGRAGRHVPGGEEAVRGELRDGPRDGLPGLGDSAHGPVAPAAP